MKSTHDEKRIVLTARFQSLAWTTILAFASGAFAEGPCDIYADAKTPCAAAHSTVRALFAAYDGNLYQVQRSSDKTFKDIPVLSPGGFADVSVQDQFCKGTTCTISNIYDQTSNHNDLKKSPKAFWLKDGGKEADAAQGQIKVDGRTVHGVYVTAWSGIGYRNNATKGVATGNQAEAMYAVVDGKRYSKDCCFDYGNAEKSGNDDGNGTMEAIYWGTDVGWGGYGQGNGPWIAADLENGMFKGNAGCWQYGDTHKTPWPTAKSVVANFATLVLKGPSDNTFKIKAGDAQQGALTTMWDGSRPSPGYSPKKLDGAIVLGTGGDGSNGGTGTFFEGAMTFGNPPDSIDEKIQANVILAGYGRTTPTSISSRHPAVERGLLANYSPASGHVSLGYVLRNSGSVQLDVRDLQGRRVAVVREGMQLAGGHEASWDASSAHSGLYLVRLMVNGISIASDRVVVGG